MKLQYLGHAGVRLRSRHNGDATELLIDPFITGNPSTPVEVADLHPDYVVVTHAHGDHWGDTPELARRTEATVIGTAEIAHYATGAGLKSHGMNIGGQHRFPFGMVRLTMAWHSSSFPDGSYGGMPTGVVLEFGGKRIYHSGDTALFSDMSLIGRLELDLAFLPIGDNYTMGPDDALEAVKLLRPKTVVPIHFNTFPLLAQDAEAFKTRVEAETSATCLVLKPGRRGMPGDDRPSFVPSGYEIISRLGAGQTSHVYLAKQSALGEVALKLPRPELSVRPVLKRMFENEVAITVRLTHPNVVTAFAGFPTGPGAFLALEYCPGGTLDQFLLERGRVPAPRCFELILDVADGLAHSHERHVLHRDVKPANVFLTEDGEAKLGDFGTGIFMGDESEERVGTAFYMAPEVFEGRAAGVRSDIYSLGVLAYEVIAGQRPFIGDSYDALMVAHHTSSPRDLRTLSPDVDAKVVRVVAKAMMRNPQGRYASAREFATALRAAAGMPKRGHSSEVSSVPKMETGRASRPDPRAPVVDHSAKAQAAEEPDNAKKRRGGLFGWLRRRDD